MKNPHTVPVASQRYQPRVKRKPKSHPERPSLFHIHIDVKGVIKTKVRGDYQVNEGTRIATATAMRLKIYKKKAFFAIVYWNLWLSRRIE